MKKLFFAFTILTSTIFYGQIYTQNGTIQATTVSNNNVGVGIIDPVSKFQVIGDICSSGSNQKIGFDTNDKFTVTSGTVARYGMSISKNIYNEPIVTHSGYFGINFFTNDLARIK